VCSSPLGVSEWKPDEITFWSQTPGRSFSERNNSPKSGSCAPDTSSQISELHNLAVINKNKRVGVRPLVLDVIRKDWAGKDKARVRQ